MKILQSKITNVTVFTDRAQIFRVAKLNLAAGEHILRFENLPESLEQKSIQVNGRGNITLKSIKFKDVFFEANTQPGKELLTQKKNEIQLIINQISDEIENTKKEKIFIENIAAKAVHTNEKSNPELNPENWIKMAQFYRSQLGSLSQEIREKEQAYKQQQAKLKKINQEIEQIGDISAQPKSVIDITLSASENQEVLLYLSYIVYNVSWSPVYNVRVSSEPQKLQLEYNAKIWQSSGEDWADITVKLSTAQVQVAGHLPEITPWFVNVYQPIQKPQKREFKKKSKERAKSASFDEFEEEYPAVTDLQKPLLVKPKAKVAQKATSTIFEAEGHYTIMSDNLDYSVSLLLEEFNAEFLHFAAPKLSPAVYLTAKIKNTSNFPLLAGAMNVFFDGGFVAESYMNHVLPNDEFEISLGADESVKAVHKLMKRYDKHEGIFTKMNIVVFEYQTKIKNSKNSEIQLTFKDNIPVSGNDKIKVELLSPKYKENTDVLQIDKQGVITQVVILKPQEEKTFDLKFEVEFQRDITVTGL